MAGYKQAREAMVDAMPLLDDLPADHPWVEMDEAALGLASHAWMAGVRAGAAYEHLRLALLSPTRVCRRCEGAGPLRLDRGDHYPHGGPRRACPDCGGRGTVPTPATTLRLTAD